jgi:hypothetical protein
VRFENDSQETDPLDLYERATNNPVSLLRFLTGASDDVRKAGSEDVRGTRTTHYEGTLNLQKVVDQASPDQRADLQEWLDFLREEQPTTVPFGLWVDSDGVARRLRIDAGEGASVLIEYYDFGVPVEITTPSEDEVISDEQLFNEIQEHATSSDCNEHDEQDEGSVGTGRLCIVDLGVSEGTAPVPTPPDDGS